MGEAVAHVGDDELRAWAEAVLRTLGATSGNARLVARSLVDSDLRGYDTQGVWRLPDYADAISKGVVAPAATPREEPTGRASLLVVDGHDGFGQVAADLAVRRLREVAADTGIAVAALRRSHHVGRLGAWVEHLAAHGLVGHALSQSNALMAAPGTATRLFGSNPMAWGLPARSGPPVIVDFATSATSVGRVAAASARGDALEHGMLVDADGAPSSTPDALFRGGALLPFGGHKGYGLSVLTDLLGGAVSGDGPASGTAYSGRHGVALLAVDPALWGGADRLLDDVERLRATLAGTPHPTGPAPRLPGERAADELERRLADGIPLEEPWLRRLDELSDRLGVAVVSRS
ncbi:Ldh family oxidoreductase [Microbacterium sp. KHB019]|uniref:Ldh family oxidoreductase n=1 Tax=Microbacterium sp. KHB019 TaxID=3129770 RepID=UPI00307AF16A